MDAKEIKVLGMMLYPLVYLDQSNSEDENLTLLDYVSADTEQQPEHLAEAKENQEILMSLLAHLDDEEKVFIMLMYGLIDGKERNKKDMVSTIRKMGESEVQKKCDQILLKLKTIADTNKIKFDL